MAYKMDPTKKKNKNGGINAIVEGIKKGAEFLNPISGRFGALRKGKMIKNSLVNSKKKKALGKHAANELEKQSPQLPSAQVSTDPTKAKDKMKATPTAKDKMKATKTTLAGPKKMKKTLTNLKRTKTSSVRPIREVRDVKPSAPKVNIKGTTLGDEKGDAPAVVVYGDKKAKTKPKKVKVKIKNNKTKIKIKK